MSKMYVETVKENRTPSDDASSVWLMIAIPTLMATTLGGFGTAGIAGLSRIFLPEFAAMTGQGYGFIVASFFAGAGIIGLLSFIGLVAAFDRSPHVRKVTNTPIVYDDDDKETEQSPIPGRFSGSVQKKGTVKVTTPDDAYSYEFTSEHIKNMLNCVDNGDMRIAQRKIGFQPGEDYQTAVYVMEKYGLWDVERKRGKIAEVIQNESGLEWLARQTR